MIEQPPVLPSHEAVNRAEEHNPKANDAQTQRQAWVQTQFQCANRFLAEKGIIPNQVFTAECRYLAPYVAIWKMAAKRPTRQTYWVISGDLPSDFVDIKVAKSAREALRHFALTWQLQAENLHRSGVTQDNTQAKFAQLLISRAESLYQIHNDEALWL